MTPTLQWPEKHQPRPHETLSLHEDPGEAHAAIAGEWQDNRLLIGDNFNGLPLLASEFGGRIKCIYVDAPYNTGAAYRHYGDARKHASWLSFIYERLQLMPALLAEDGILFVSINDEELAYVSLLLDEILGRRNFCGRLVWEKKKKPSFLDANLGVVTEYILAYAKDRRCSPPFIGGRTTAGKRYPLNNAGNGRRILCFPAGSVAFGCPDQVFEPQDMSEGNIITALLDRLVVRNGSNVAAFRLEGEWRYSQATIDQLIAAGERLVISRVPFRPNHIKLGGEPKKLKNLLTLRSGMSSYEDGTEESRALFGPDQAFQYPKPERLMAALITAVTAEGDWVLDPFAGSGTTGAVAHKLRRRWIMLESGQHAQTHIIPRMRKVIGGSDSGGVTQQARWRGGGGFRTFRLVPAADIQEGCQQLVQPGAVLQQ